MLDTVRRRPRYCICTVLVALLGVSSSAYAATKTWTGSGADFFWSTAANWSPPGAPVPGDDLVFPAGALQLLANNDTAPGTAYTSISFTGPVGGYALGGNAIQLAAGISANNSTFNAIILAITLGAPQTFSVTGLTLDFLGAITLGANTLTVTTPSNGLVRVSGGVSGSGGLTLVGPGYVAIESASCSYTGPTNITGGTFQVFGASLSPVSAVTVASGAVLEPYAGGSMGPVTINPGGFLYVGGPSFVSQIGNVTNLTIQPGSFVSFPLYSATNYGQLNVSGTATLTGSTLICGFGYTPTPGTAFTLINKTSGGAVTGTFSGLPEGGTLTSGGRLLQITYLGGNGNDVVLTDVGPAPPDPSAVPAIGTLGLALLGALLALSAVIVLRRSA